MDQIYSNNENIMPELEVDFFTGNSFKEAAKWSRFISIVYAVLIALVVVIIAITGTAVVTDFDKYFPDATFNIGQMAGGILLSIVAVGVIITCALIWFLYRFGQLTKAGIEQQQQALFKDGIKSLKNYFVIYGVIIILAFALSIIGTFAALITLT